MMVNKITLIIILLSLILLVGCTEKIVYINQTVEKEVIKVCPDCILNTTSKCPDCNCYEQECKPEIRTIVSDDCTKKLNTCYIRLDYWQDQVTILIEENNTIYNEELLHNLTDCQNELNETKEDIIDLLD